MSMIVFAGSAQFTAVAILAGGGGVGTAIGAAAMMNSRFLPMGVALAPSLPGRAVKRAAQGQTVVDASWAIAAREDGTVRPLAAVRLQRRSQYLTWTLGTVVGVLGGEALGDPHSARARRALPGVLRRAADRRGAQPPRAQRGRARRADRARARAVRPRRRAGAGGQRGRADRAQGARVSDAVLLIAGHGARHVRDQGGRPDRARRPRAARSASRASSPCSHPRCSPRWSSPRRSPTARSSPIGTDTVGVVAGGLVAWRTGSVIGCVLVAAAVTALLRAL